MLRNSRGLLRGYAPRLSPSNRPLQRYYSTPKKQEVDVIVVGSGCSGLTTALVTAKHGLDTLVLEKTRYFGGTTAFSGGGMWLSNNKYQPMMGITDDSFEKADQYLQNILGPLYEKEKIASFLASAPKMLEWLEASSNMRFQPVPTPDYHQSTPGASVGRTLLTQGSFDGRRLGPLVKDFRYPIQGLKVLRDGEEIFIYARKGVVLASGGFGRSPEAKQYVPHEWCAAPRGNTGDGKRIGVESGGALPPKNPENAVFAPISILEVEGQPTRRFPHFFDRSKPGSVIVDINGKRFANESAPYQNFVAAMHEKGIQKAFYIADHTYLRKYGMETLEQTIEQFNSFAKTGIDIEYQRGEEVNDRFYGDATVSPNPNLGTCETGPFYALPLYPGNVSTVYGLSTNTDAQVLDEQGQAIAGLYAVGCDQNQVFKGGCPGAGSSIGPGMIFGFRAGLKLAGSD
ncbi:hypothetical protein N7488_002453 [Penicillium malachiteum]|nr:hypothetical protein N7488_002453 [Penicillium malachiteum]